MAIENTTGNTPKMHTETISGLHKCQPKNEPQPGQIKTFQVIHNPAKNDKKAWIKIKSASEDKGGTPYRIVSVEPTGWEPDDYGNVSFNLEIEPTLGGAIGEKTHNPVQAASVAPSQNSRPISKDDYWNLKLQHEIAREPHITRMHSQSMALEVLKLKVTLNELTVEDLTPGKLRSLADYFDADVMNSACP